MSDKPQTIEFTLLKDQPLQGKGSFEQSKFGHLDIARTLAQMVLQCPTPFTIGLFGKWGSGKSTIANMLTSELATKSVPVVLFDVWKHEGDSLRRSFLKELVGQLKGTCLGKNFVLNDRLEHSLGRTNEGTLKFHKGKAAQLLIALCVIVSVVVGGAVLASRFGLGAAYNTFLGVFFGSALVVWLLNLFTQVIGTETTTFSQEKLQDPHEFESEFARIIVAAKSSRILIIFDNLDRVKDEKALEALTTIKTFLEPRDSAIPEKGIVFLIPCDDKAIRAHIGAVYGNNSHGTPGNRAFDPDEFLRKFFNTVLWIPDFIASELESYAHACLKETKLHDLDDGGIAWLITKAFRENPRQIIQFINILVSNFVLIKEREGEDGSERDFDEGFAQKNRLEICLYLLLNHLYPTIMAELRVRKATTLSDIDVAKLQSFGVNDPDVSRFLDFVNQVKSEVTITNLRTYYSLRRSDQEKRFPGIDRLFELLEDNEVAKAKEQAATMEQLGSNIDDLSLAIKTHFENISSPATQAYFLSGLLETLEDRKITLNVPSYGEFHSKLVQESFQDRIDTVSPKFLYANMLSHHSQFQRSVVEKWIKRIAVIAVDEKLRKVKETFILEAFELLAQFPDLAAGFEEEVKGLLASSFASDLKVARLFVKSKKAQQMALSKEFVQNFIGSISERDLAAIPKAADKETSIPERWAVLVEIDDSLMGETQLAAAMGKFTEVLSQRAPQPFTPEVAKDRDLLFSSLSIVLDRYTQVKLSEVVTTKLIDSVVPNLNATPEWFSKSKGPSLLVRLYKLAKDPKKTELVPLIQQFATHATPKAVEDCGANLGGPQVLIDLQPLTAILEQRSIAESTMFDLFFGTLPDAKKTDWLLKLLNAATAEGLRRIKAMDHKVPDPDRILSHLLTMAKSATGAVRAEIYECLIAMKCGADPDHCEKFSVQVTELITSSDASNQKLGADIAAKSSFLPANVRRTMVKGVFDWIDGQQGVARYQPNALNMLSGNLVDLNRPEKEKLADICLDELIVKVKDLAATTLGFNVLDALKLTEGDFLNNYLDVQKRFNEETDESIKAVIRDGLKKLRPKTPAEKEVEFWEWVDGLK